MRETRSRMSRETTAALSGCNACILAELGPRRDPPALPTPARGACRRAFAALAATLTRVPGRGGGEGGRAVTLFDIRAANAPTARLIVTSSARPFSLSHSSCSRPLAL